MKKLEWTTQQRKVDELLPLEINPRKISEEKKQELLKSLERFNLVDIPVINADGKLISGHQRCKVLQMAGRGSEMIDVRLPNRMLTEKEVKEYNLISNTHSGEFDFDILDEFFGDIDFADIGFEVVRPAQEPMQPIEIDEADDIEEDYAETVATDIILGDLFQIGPHRLMCGSSTEADAVAALLNGVVPILMTTDPPYGVNYDPKWRDEAHAHGHFGNMDDKFGSRSVGKVSNDDKASWAEAYSLFPGDVAYIWHADIYSNIIAEDLIDCGFKLVGQIIWAKPHFVLSRGDYHWQHEPCWYATKKGRKHNWQGSRKETTLWQIKGMNPMGGNGEEKTGHGTQKPVECMARPILNNSRIGEAIYDPFLGSGTSMVAAHQNNRICYGMELSPKYCQSVIDRMKKLFPGISVKKLN